jgi:hypothetical protein
MPTELHRRTLVKHIEALERFMRQTPEHDETAAKATLITVTKLLLALPSAKMSETGAEARGEAFMVALEDVPFWATAEAVKGWYRDSHGAEHDYRWAPAPAVLRKLSQREAWKVGGRISSIKRVLAAEPRIEFSEEHRAQMLKRLATEIPEAFGLSKSGVSYRDQAPTTADKSFSR